MTFEAVPGFATGLDSGLPFPECTAVYLLRSGSTAVLVDTSAASRFETLQVRLRELGVTKLDAILPTHVHLDHAGGVGHFARAYPEAVVIGHPRAVRHLVDPARLVAGARAVWGAERYDELYGDMLPTPEAGVREVADGECLSFGEMELQFFDAPGHARHHYIVWHAETRTVFAGDAFGLSYAGGMSYPSSSPVQFDPEAALRTVDLIESLDPMRVAIAHYGVLLDIPERSQQMRSLIRDFVNIALANEQNENRESAIRDALRELHPPHPNRERYEIDIEINAQGLCYWLDHREATT